MTSRNINANFKFLVDVEPYKLVILSVFRELKKQVCWINKVGVSRGATLICFQLNTNHNWINYDLFIELNNKMYSLDYS